MYKTRINLVPGILAQAGSGSQPDGTPVSCSDAEYFGGFGDVYEYKAIATMRISIKE